MGMGLRQIVSSKRMTWKKGLIGAIQALLLLMFVLLTVYWFDKELLLRQAGKLIASPGWLLLMTVGYAASFFLRAWAWKVYTEGGAGERSERVGVRFRVYVSALFYSLLINHLLPVKAGDAVRIGVLLKEKEIRPDVAVHSVIAMRVLDLLVLGLMAAGGSLLLGAPLQAEHLLPAEDRLPAWWLAGVWLAGIGLAMVMLFIVIRRRFPDAASRHLQLLKRGLTGAKGVTLIIVIFIGWMLEAVVIYGVLLSLDLSVTWWVAVWVNSMTIAGQIFHLAPGGLGTYESVMAVSLYVAGITWQDAYTAALISHGFKFAFSYAAGLIVVWKFPVRLRDIRGWVRNKGAERT